MNPKQTSARERLMQLQPWFTAKSAALQLGLPQAKLQVYLSRWKAAGLIESFGPRTGVYFNLIKLPEGADRWHVEALKHLYPEATLMGDSVLHAAGWITQIPSKTHVAILAHHSHLNPKGFRIHQRAKRWFMALRDSLLSAEEGEAGFGLRELTPAAALADLIASGQAPEPDDLYLETDDVIHVQAVCRELGLSDQSVSRALGELYDEAFNQGLAP